MLYIKWLGHDTFRIKNMLTLYTDPFQINEAAKDGDIILITHDHYDHCSLEDVLRVAKPGATIVIPPSCASKFSGFSLKQILPGDSFSIGDIKITAIPAYNINKFRSPGQVFHPKDAGGVGYVIEVSGKRIYHAGDTDHIPEMKGLSVDVALLPVSGIYVMTAEEAAQAANDIKPGLVIPMHFGAIVGNSADAERFSAICSFPTKILSQGETLNLE